MKSRFLILLISVFVISSTQSCREKIDAGYEGALVKQYGTDKGVDDVTLETGSVWYNPWTEDVIETPLFVQNADYQTFSVTAKDGSTFQVDPRVAYRVTQGQSPKIIRKYRKEISELQATVLNTYTRDAFRVIFGRYPTDSIISIRDSIETQITNYLAGVLEVDGFHLEQLTYSWVLPKAIEEAIDNKNKEKSKAIEAENRVKTAEAEAKEKVVRAQAEADANRIVNASLSPALLQLEFIKAWKDTKQPIYGSPPVMFKSIQ